MAEGKAVLNALKSKGYNVKPSGASDDGDEYVVVRIPRPGLIMSVVKRRGKQLLHAFKNGLWPATPTTLMTVIMAVTLTTVAAERDSWLRSGWLANLLWNIDEIIIQRLFNPLKLRQPIWFRVAYLASTMSFVGVYAIVWLERLILRFLLSFTSFYLFRSPTQRNPPLEVRLWGALVTLLSGSKKMTYAFQPCLPRLPVPSLHDTTTRYLASMEPLVSDSSFQRLTMLADTFMKSPQSLQLQQYLWFRRYITCTNYVTPWWEKYVYLSMRDSLAINGNYYVMDCVSNPVHDQVFRAANLVHHMVRLQRMIEREELLPLMLHDTVPLCMDQYERVFGSTRIPKKDVDVLRHTAFSRHVVVVRRSRFYKLKTVHDDGSDTILSPAEFAHQLRVVMEHANMDATMHDDESGGTNGSDVMALTSLPRADWARIREQHFLSHEDNSVALEMIETASFLLHLDHLENMQVDSDTSSPRHSKRKGIRRARALFHGRSDTLFFDKSLNLLVFDDGIAGLSVEHAGFDAPITAHVWEHVLLSELIDVENDLDASSRAGESLRGPPLPVPTRFSFHVSDVIRKEARRARKLLKERINDVDLEIVAFDAFGQGLPKSHGISPDSFVQMALQLAYFYEQNKFDLTYESCTTKLFCEGRTETIRTVSQESCMFVKSAVHLMDRFVTAALGTKARKWDAAAGEDDDDEEDEGQGMPAVRLGTHVATSSSSSSNMVWGGRANERLDIEKKLRLACERHQVKSRAAMAGMGCDRHLFALYLAAKGSNITSEFLEAAMGGEFSRWRLSTSQQPQHQTTLRDQIKSTKIVSNFISPGGGFGPIEDDGYGVAYTFGGENVLFFHITAKKKANPVTDARRFAIHVRAALMLMGEIVRYNQVKS